MRSRPFVRKAVRIMLVTLVVLLGSALVLTGVLLAISPGRPEPFRDAAGKPLTGSLSEKFHVNINGVPQGMFIRSKDQTKPVLLFLHGGPGMPLYAFSRQFTNVLEDDFTVCWWEQRGAGLSYRSDMPPESVTVAQLVSDTIAVTNYLRERFGQAKIYLMGHSWGSFLGIQAAAQAPELYHAYIGVAQMARQLESEKLAWQYMVDQYTRAGNERMVQRLGKFPIPELNEVPNAYRNLRDQAMHDLGIGTTRTMKSVVSGIFMPVNLSRAYTLREKINLWRGKWSPRSNELWHEMIATDVTARVPKLDLPVYFLHGRYDYTDSYTLAKQYFGQLQAPLKGFYTFEQSAHSPQWEEPGKAQRIMQQDVLAGRNSLADLPAGSP
ncbi:MAG TPA: alpha/beta hydrolase [Symbiobacteriaceae bacterium]|nr:alpha/beta hydrolase [Symbiobacteriaceae bacterium]